MIPNRPIQPNFCKTNFNAHKETDQSGGCFYLNLFEILAFLFYPCDASFMGYGIIPYYTIKKPEWWCAVVLVVTYKKKILFRLKYTKHWWCQNLSWVNHWIRNINWHNEKVSNIGHIDAHKWEIMKLVAHGYLLYILGILLKMVLWKLGCTVLNLCRILIW